MEHLFIMMIIILIAALLQAGTGYGFSIIGTPFLLILYPVHQAIQINIILSICLSLLMIFKIKDDIDKTLLFRLVSGSIPGVPLGIVIYLFFDVDLLKLIIGALIIMLTLLLILNFPVTQTRNKDFFTGGISGLLTASIGVPGPPLLLYFSGTKISPAVLRSTTLAYYLFIYTVSLMIQISFGGTDKSTWVLALVAMPPLFIGALLGHLFFKRINQNTFRLITYGILFFTGIYLLLGS